MMFSGVHAYTSSPVELWHANFKKFDINPRHVKIGRKNFETVIKLVMDRVL